MKKQYEEPRDFVSDRSVDHVIDEQIMIIIGVAFGFIFGVVLAVLLKTGPLVYPALAVAFIWVVGVELHMRKCKKKQEKQEEAFLEPVGNTKKMFETASLGAQICRALEETIEMTKEHPELLESFPESKQEELEKNPYYDLATCVMRAVGEILEENDFTE